MYGYKMREKKEGTEKRKQHVLPDRGPQGKRRIRSIKDYRRNTKPGAFSDPREKRKQFSSSPVVKRKAQQYRTIEPISAHNIERLILGTSRWALNQGRQISFHSDGFFPPKDHKSHI